MKNSSARIKNINDLSTIDQVRNILNWAFENTYGIACWKKPGESTLNLTIDYAGGSSSLQLEENLSENTFLFHPFKVQKDVPIVSLRADLKIQFNLSTPNSELEENKDLSSISETVSEILEKQSKKEKKPYYQKEFAEYNKQSSHQHFTQMVRQAIEEIQDNKLEKVVPARNKKITLKKDYDLAESLLTLAHNYPNAMVSLVSSPMCGTWIGATPEMLVTENEDGIFKTVALAGTQSWKEGKDLKKVSWTQKEIEEQALVSRYIINCFKKIRLREFKEEGPKTIKAGNLIHLKTTFTVDTKAVNFPKLSRIMLDLLHPTSAVCGMPKDEALHFIKTHENFNRAYFSGFLGPVNELGATDLFVNLRCANLLSEEAVLFAGAGITADSEAESEWKETNLKCNIMGSYLI